MTYLSSKSIREAKRNRLIGKVLRFTIGEVLMFAIVFVAVWAIVLLK
jgi:hypothetical protein